MLIKQAGVPAICFHDLRHTHATLLMRNNVNPKIVSERLGQANIDITLDHYAHVSEEMQREAAVGLGALLDNQELDEDNSSLGKAL
ncbi:MAG: tyrosine-type recombinase/integrase [Chloroflexota bacterium]|nr:tyrosine-type recombinase/integrase [Chloroflexota bacterium]